MFTGDVIDSDDLTGFDEAWDNFDVLLEETNELAGEDGVV